MDQQHAFDAVTALIANDVDHWDCYNGPDARKDMQLLSDVCIERCVPFVWSPVRSAGGRTYWRLRLVSHPGIGFRAPWAIVSTDPVDTGLGEPM